MRKVTFNYFACLVETEKRLFRALFVSHAMACVFKALLLFMNFYIYAQGPIYTERQHAHNIASNISHFNCLQIS